MCTPRLFSVVLSLLATASVTLITASCEKEFDPDDSETNISNPSNPSQPETRVFRFAATSNEETKTSFGSNYQVLWQENDQLRIAKNEANEGSKLRVILNANGTGLAIKLNNNNDAQIQYDDIKVEIEGVDVTAEILSNETSSNPYRIGATNSSDSNYQFSYNNVPIDVNRYSNGGFLGLGTSYYAVIARSTSGSSESLTELQKLSDNRKAIITFTNLQFRQKTSRTGSSWGDWIAINKNNAGSYLVNGGNIGQSGLNNCNEYFWPTNDFDLRMQLVKGIGASSAEFEGTTTRDADLDNSIAVYPYSAFSKYTNGNITLTLPQVQYYTNNSFDPNSNLMVGDVVKKDSNTYGSKMNNMLGVLELTLSTNGDDIYLLKSISVTDNGNNMLWGTAVISGSSISNGINSNNLSGGNSTITLNCEGISLSEEPKKFYLLVPIGAFSNGFSVAIEKADTKTSTFSTSKANTISKNTVKVMPKKSIAFDTQTINLENSDLQWFLNTAKYTNWGDRGILYNNTSNQNRVKHKDYPVALTVSLYGDNSNLYYISLDDETNDTAVFTDREVTDSEYTFINMIPGHSYSYTIKNSNGDILCRDHFNTTGNVRMIKIDDTWNVRDLGGWTGIGGNKVVYGWIYRGGSLNGKYKNSPATISVANNGNPDNYNILSNNSHIQLKDVGIKAELDLRGKSTDSGESGTDYPHKYSFGFAHNNPELYSWNYYQIKTDGAQSSPSKDPSLVRDVAWIIDQVLYHNNPVYFHCKSGADRTGIVAVVLHALLGVSIGDLAVDFEITNFSHEYADVRGNTNVRGKYTYQNNDTPYTYIFGLNKGSLQENAYFYLNKQFEDYAIDSYDLDRFIEKMLGLRLNSYHQVGGVKTDQSLQSIHGYNN